MACPSKIRIATVLTRDMKVHKNEDGSIEFSGPQGRILDIILKAMKVEFELLIPEDGEWGRLLENGSWTGIIGKVQNNEADIAFNEININEERTKVVDFTEPYSTDDMMFAIAKPEATPTAMAFIHAFDSIVWFLTIITLLIMPIFIKCLCKTKDTYINILIDLLGSILKQSVSKKLKMCDSLKYKINMYFWCIFATIWAFSYSSVLLSILTLPSEIPTVKNFKELSAAVEKGEYKCYAPKGSATLDSFFDSNKDYLKKLGHIIVSNGWYSNHECLIQNQQIGRKSALVSPKHQLQLVAGPEDWKPDFLSDDSLIQHHAAIAVNKGYCRKEIINTLITRFNYAGLYSKILSEDHFLAWLAASDKRRFVTKERKPLSLSILFGAFGLLSFGLGLSFIAFIGEIVYSYLQSYKNKP